MFRLTPENNQTINLILDAYSRLSAAERKKMKNEPLDRRSTRISDDIMYDPVSDGLWSDSYI